MSPLTPSSSVQDDIGNSYNARQFLDASNPDKAFDFCIKIQDPEQKNDLLCKIALYWINTKHNPAKALEVIASCTDAVVKQGIRNFADSKELIF